MSDTNTPSTEAPAKDAPAAEPAKAETDWQAEARKWESRAKSNKEAADELAALKDAQKSEQTKLTERAEKAERELAAARLDADRASVALAKGLDPELAPLLSGATKEEIEKKAELLAARLSASKPSTTPRKPPASGASRPDTAGLTDKGKAAAALRQSRGQG